jgi:CheY-like chemotaxis protein
MLPQVLVVDDQEFNVEVAGKMIERHLGLSFDSAYSAKEGIEKIWIRNSSNL